MIPNDSPVRPPAPPSEVTRLLRRWSDGDLSARDRLMPLVYHELHRVAHQRLGGERTGHTLQTTALVHEAYARFADSDVRWQDRAHFFALAARTMRRILVDYARARLSDRRGAGAERVSLENADLGQSAGDDHVVDLLTLSDALVRLESQDARKAQIVEAHLFGGLTQEETAEVMAISTATVNRELKLAKAWLARELS